MPLVTLHDWSFEDLENALDGLYSSNDNQRKRAINMVKAELNHRRGTLARLAKNRG